MMGMGIEMLPTTSTELFEFLLSKNSDEIIKYFQNSDTDAIDIWVIKNLAFLMENDIITDYHITIRETDNFAFRKISDVNVLLMNLDNLNADEKRNVRLVFKVSNLFLKDGVFFLWMIDYNSLRSICRSTDEVRSVLFRFGGVTSIVRRYQP